MAPRRRGSSEAPSLKHYRDWSTARDMSKDAQTDLGGIIKQAVTALAVGKKPFKQACEWRRMASVKAVAQINDLRQLCYELGITDENFRPLQSEMFSEIDDTEPAV